jgi:hypothetical protein
MESVLESVRAAAADALDAGAATLEVTTVKELYGGASEYDARAVVLSPYKRGAATVVVELEGSDVAWLTVAGGPGYEFYEGDSEERLAKLRDLVAAVVAGGYADAWRDEREWVATFHMPAGPVSTARVGPARPAHAERARRFAPY